MGKLNEAINNVFNGEDKANKLLSTELDCALECLGDSNGCPENADCFSSDTETPERVCKECWRKHIETLAKSKEEKECVNN